MSVLPALEIVSVGSPINNIVPGQDILATIAQISVKSVNGPWRMIINVFTTP